MRKKHALLKKNTFVSNTILILETIIIVASSFASVQSK